MSWKGIATTASLHAEAMAKLQRGKLPVVSIAGIFGKLERSRRYYQDQMITQGKLLADFEEREQGLIRQCTQGDARLHSQLTSANGEIDRLKGELKTRDVLAKVQMEDLTHLLECAVACKALMAKRGYKLTVSVDLEKAT